MTSLTPAGHRDNPLAYTALAYLAGVVLSEVATTYVEPRLGLVMHCLLLQGLLLHASRTRQPEKRAFLVSMTLAPLIRILSLALPLTHFSVVYWYLITSVPLFAAAFVTGRTLGFSWSELGLNLRRWPLQLLVGLSGLAFGTLEYLILRPKPLAPRPEWAYLWWPALVLFVSTGLLEELIFRGLLQRVARAGLGRWGLTYVALLFATLHIGYRSLADLVFVLSAGLFMGWVVQRTGSLLGVTLAHALTNIMLFLIVPFLALNELSLSPPADYWSLAIEARLIDGLMLGGWLSVSVLSAIVWRGGHTPQSQRLVSATLALALLRAVRLLWPVPHLTDALATAEPLLLIWPFVVASIPIQLADGLLALSFYALILATGGAWRFGRFAGIAFPLDSHTIWMGLRLGGALIGQLLLWRQRLLAVRAALLLLALGAVASALGSTAGELTTALTILPLLWLHLYWARHAPVSKTVPAVQAVADKDPSLKASHNPGPSPSPRRGQLYERRQLLSLRLASIAAFEAQDLPATLRAMLQAFTAVAEVDLACVLLHHDTPAPGLVQVSRYQAQHPGAPTRPTVLDRMQAPALFHALHQNRTVIYHQCEWGENLALDQLFRALGEAQPGPTIVHPIAFQQVTHGLLIAGNPGSKRTLSDAASQLCPVLTARVATVIAPAHRVHTTASQAERRALSPKTGVPMPSFSSASN